MANTPQARKRIRRNNRRTDINTARRSRLRTFIRKVETAIAAGDSSAAQSALKDMQPELRRAAAKGIVHKNTAARKLSRLNARVKAISAAS
ncbi:MAG: 30S ribosomal protein S20 [Sphingomonadales bacterium]